MSKNDYGRVAVLMGGRSAEREISLQSGGRVLESLLRQGVDAVGIDPADEQTLPDLHGQGIDRVFIALHGRGGEDGSMQGVLEQLGLPYTGSGVLASALTMDKDFTKRLWREQGLPTPGHTLLQPDTDWDAVVQQLGLPVIVKPAREGSSVGACKVSRSEEMVVAWKQARCHDTRVIAECWIEGGEYTVPILEACALPVIKVETERQFYDYQAKYQDEATRYLCPCGLSAERERELQSLAIAADACLGTSGWGRVDAMLDQSGKVWLIEHNTVPGMTAHSLVPMAASVAGIDFDHLVLRILDTSLPVHADAGEGGQQWRA